MTSSASSGRAAARPVPDGGDGPAFGWRFQVPLYLGSALNPVNSSLLATALVPLAHDLAVPAGRTAVLVAGLYLASAVAQPTAGKAADVLGARRVLLFGIVLVLAGGVVGGVAAALPELVVSRVLIGVGTSCAYPTAMVLIRTRATDRGLQGPPGSVLGGLQIAGVATASLGLPLGGVLVQLLGWRSVFLVNVPLALIALVVTLRWIPRDRVRTRWSAGSAAAAIDLPGVLGFAAAMTTLLLFVFPLPDARWWLLGLSAVLWAGDIAWELHVRRPFLDVRLLRANAALSRTYLRFGLVFLCSYLVLYGVTQWVQSSRGFSALGAGLLLLPMTAVSGLVVAPIARRNLVRGPLIAAAVACLAAGALALLLPTAGWLAVLLIATVLLGLATGAASSNSIALYRQVDPERVGVASGLMRSAGYIGSIASSATTAIVFRDGVSDGGVVVIAVVMLAAGVVLLVLTAVDRAIRPVAR